MTTLIKPSPGIRALFSGLAYAYGTDENGYPRSHYDRESVDQELFEIEVNLWFASQHRKAPTITKDSGNTHQLWLFSFGAYGDHDVYVWGDGDICDALEAAAETLPPGYFTEPDYAEAAKELGYPLDASDEDEQNEIRDTAEADLTYTESGYLLSYEWWGTEIEPQDALDRMWDAR